MQYVKNSWEQTADMRAQFYAQQGYLVMKLDNRGSISISYPSRLQPIPCVLIEPLSAGSLRRGVDFETAIYHDMGNMEIQDQITGVKKLVKEGLADPAHVGIYGWSYGGYMSAMAVARRGDVFKVRPFTHCCLCSQPY